MKKTIKKIGKKISIFAVLSMMFVLPLVAGAAPAFDKYLSDVAGPSGLSGDGTRLPSMIGSGISILLGVLGVLLVLIVIYAGFLWMTANGKEDNIKKAKAMIYNSVIGLIIIFAAYAITTFVLAQLSTIQ